MATARAREAATPSPPRAGRRVLPGERLLPGERSRARYPDQRGVASRDGGRVAWEAYGTATPAIVFVPPWQIAHSRIWKAQVPDFARRHRVVTWDARGNGHSDRPLDPAAHSAVARAADLAAVLDATGTDAAVLVGLSGASRPMIVFASAHPERVLGLCFVAPASPFGEPGPADAIPFEDPLPDDRGWHKENVHFWRRDFRAYLEHFFAEAFPEPHSTRQRENGVEYGLATDPESLAATVRAPGLDRDALRTMCASIRCPTLVVQGTDDRITDVTQGTGLAAAIPGARLVLMEGSGHVLNAREPVRLNLLLREFMRTLRDPR